MNLDPDADFMDTKSEIKKLRTQVDTLRMELETERKLRLEKHLNIKQFVDDINDEFLVRYYGEEGMKDSYKGFG